MTGEIDKDFYCSGNAWDDDRQGCFFNADLAPCRKHGCRNYHRKHPTPEQFKEEYGFEYPDDGAVYVELALYSWHVQIYLSAKNFCNAMNEKYPIVCACTPYGKPDDKWKPEVKE